MVFRSEDAIREMNTLLKSSLQGQPGAAATTFGVAKGIYAKKLLRAVLMILRPRFGHNQSMKLWDSIQTGHGGIDTA